MLREEAVLRIALALSILGIVLIALLEQFFQPTELPISEINEGMAGKIVGIRGVVEWKKEKNGAIIFGLNDGQKIKCVFFGKEKIFPGMFVLAEGIVEIQGQEIVITVRRFREWKQ